MDIRFLPPGGHDPEAVVAIFRDSKQGWIAPPDLDLALLSRVEAPMAEREDGVADVLSPAGRRRLVEVKQALDDAAALACQRTSAPVHLELGALPAEEAAALGRAVALSAYRFDRYRTKASPEPRPSWVSISAADPEAADRLFEREQPLVEAVCFARDLISEPPNVLTPPEFAERMRPLAELGLDVEVLDVAAMQSLGMGALLAVGQGSRSESRLVVLRWRGSDERPVALVGKGLCFDSGGISLKAGENMDQMKWDMGGAAVVAAVLRAAAARKLPLNLVGVLAIAENMPDGGAYRPGDVLASMSGQTIEVINTDAEGRLVLADAMTYCQERFSPSVLIDIATLTGSIEVALGKDMAGYFSNDDGLALALDGASAESGDLMWRMPLVSSYEHLIDSDVADMKNLAERNAVGAVTAALFLQRFVDEGVSWAHLDIAGVAWKKQSRRPSLPSGATGFGVALLDSFLRRRAA